VTYHSHILLLSDVVLTKPEGSPTDTLTLTLTLTLTCVRVRGVFQFVALKCAAADVLSAGGPKARERKFGAAFRNSWG
jgi:hypothetical protein